MKESNIITWVIPSRAEQVDWDSVYQASLPRIYNYFLYRVGEKDAAEDLTAITFERAWRLRARYRSGIASLPTWLFGIARNVFKEYLRKHKYQDNNMRQALVAEMSGSINLETDYQKQQEREKLLGLINNLPERERDLIALKYGAELTNREIARLTDLSESNVGSILHRAVNAIRRNWEVEHG